MSWMILAMLALMCTVPDYRKYGKYLLISVEVRLSLDFGKKIFSCHETETAKKGE